jgi:hypothetical protein
VPPLLPPATGPGPTDLLQALVFLDLDGDGEQGTSEPGVPAVDLDLDGHSVGTTGSDGSFRVSVRHGIHRLVAAAPPALAVVSTSDGRSAAAVQVPASQSSAWWALRGRSSVHLSALHGAVSWTWAGGDGLFGTADDVTGVSRAGRNGLTLRGMPAGAYRIAGVPARVAPGQTLTALGGGAMSLPFTGGELLLDAATGGALLTGGAAFLLLGRRRRLTT